MQIFLNRAPTRNDIIVKCIISIYDIPVGLAFYKGNLFKSVTVIETILKYPTVKINSKL